MNSSSPAPSSTTISTRDSRNPDGSARERIQNMLPTETIRSLARRLYDARKSRTQLRHFSTEHGGMTIEDGYAIQSEWVRLEMADGRSIKGPKIGLPSRRRTEAWKMTM